MVGAAPGSGPSPRPLQRAPGDRARAARHQSKVCEDGAPVSQRAAPARKRGRRPLVDEGHRNRVVTGDEPRPPVHVFGEPLRSVPRKDCGCLQGMDCACIPVRPRHELELRGEAAGSPTTPRYVGPDGGGPGRPWPDPSRKECGCLKGPKCACVPARNRHDVELRGDVLFDIGDSQGGYGALPAIDGIGRFDPSQLPLTATLSVSYPEDLAQTFPNGRFATFRPWPEHGWSPIQFDLSVDGGTPGAGRTFAFRLEVYDIWGEPAQQGEPLYSRTFSDFLDSDGRWSTRWDDPPHPSLGFYRVRVVRLYSPKARTRVDVVLPMSGTRPAGHFTYAVVPEPETRPFVRSSDAFFGLLGLITSQRRQVAQGRPRPDLASWLGVRWTPTGGFAWSSVIDPWYQYPWLRDTGWDNLHGSTGATAAGGIYRFHEFRKPPGPLDHRWARVASAPPDEAGSPEWRLYQQPILWDLLFRRGTIGKGAATLNDIWRLWFEGGGKLPGEVDTYGTSLKRAALAWDAASRALPPVLAPERWESFAEQAAKTWRYEEPAPRGMDLRPYEVMAEPNPDWGYRGVAKPNLPVSVGWAATPDDDEVWTPSVAADEPGARQVTMEKVQHVFRLGAPAIRRGDPEASVLGPGSMDLQTWDEGPRPGYYDPFNWTDGLRGVHFTQRDILSQGLVDETGTPLLGEFGRQLRVIDVLDGYSVHPYHRDQASTDEDIVAQLWPEARIRQLDPAGNPTAKPDTLPLRDAIESVKQGLAELEAEGAGRSLDLYATEFGWPTMGKEANNGAPERDLGQALAHIRQNLILLGEGFRLGISFSAYDRRLEPGLRCGFYYNPETTAAGGLVSYPETLFPRPVAAAYAAMTWLLEGHRALGRVVGLENSDLMNAPGAHQYGYAYRAVDGSDEVLALWDWAGTSLVENLPIGVLPGHMEAYDWMGSSIYPEGGQLQYQGGSIWDVELSTSPIYIVVRDDTINPDIYEHGPLTVKPPVGLPPRGYDDDGGPSILRESLQDVGPKPPWAPGPEEPKR